MVHADYLDHSLPVELLIGQSAYKPPLHNFLLPLLSSLLLLQGPATMKILTKEEEQAHYKYALQPHLPARALLTLAVRRSKAVLLVVPWG